MPSTTYRSRNRDIEPIYGSNGFDLYDGSEINNPSTELSGWETMTDYVQSGFHSRVANGEVFNNPVNYSSFRITQNPSSCRYFKTKTSDPSWWIRMKPESSYTGNYYSKGKIMPGKWNTWTLSYPPDVEQGAKQAALANVDGTPYEFFEDIAELRETIEFIKHPLQSLAGVAKAFSRKKQEIYRRPWKDFEKRSKALADAWNTYRFAAAPLVRSVMTALEAYNDREKSMRPSRRTAHGFRDSETPPVVSNVLTAQTLVCNWDWKIVESYTLQGHASIYYEVTNPIDDWSFRLGLRLKDIPVTMWEIVPLSFMVDRVVNIKNAIAGILNIADPSVTFLASSYTTRKKRAIESSILRQWYPYGDYNATIINPDSITRELFTMERVKWEPGLKDTIPAFTPKYLIDDVAKLTDLLAITISRLL